MARKPRNETEPGTWHVYSRGNRSWPIFEDDSDRLTFLVGLATTSRDREWRLLSWCLMNNHFHLLVETTSPNLGDGMKWLLCGYARTYNERYGHANHLFGDRYGSTWITDADHLRAAARYVVRNPVKAELVDDPRDWAWSSWPGRKPDKLESLTDDRRLLEYFGGCYDLYEQVVQAA